MKLPAVRKFIQYNDLQFPLPLSFLEATINSKHVNPDAHIKGLVKDCGFYILYTNLQKCPIKKWINFHQYSIRNQPFKT